MTLLRNDLRSEDKGRQQTGWLENIIPRKSKDAVENGSSGHHRVIAEESRSSEIPAYPTNEIAPEPKQVKAKAKPAVIEPAAAIEPAPSPVRARVERAIPAPSPRIEEPAPTDSEASSKLPVLGLVSGVAFVLLGAISVLKGKDAWLGALVLLTVGLLAGAILAIWNRSGRHKAFWEGFAVFGLGYFFLAFVPAFANGLELPTSDLIRVGHAKLTATPVDPRGAFEIMKPAPKTPEAKELYVEPGSPEAKSTESASAPLISMGDIRQFTVVGHCVFTIAFAFLGSALAGWFYRTGVLV